MVLVAFLGSRLGFAPRKLLRRKKMSRSVGEGKIRKRAGTTRLWLPHVSGRASRSRPFAWGERGAEAIASGSVRHLELI
jgi:hypothetical protein